MEPSKIKTSESLLVIGGLILIIILSAFIPASWFGIHPMVYKDKPLDLAAITSASEIAKDTNGDGVISWKEVISQTFKESSSTEDSSQNNKIDQKAVDAMNDPQNLTGSFSKNLYLASAYLKENDITDEASQQATLNQLISQEADKMIPTTYSYKDIKIAKKEDKASLKAYGNSLTPLIQAIVTQKIIASDFASISSFTQSKNEADLYNITKNQEHLNAITQKLLLLSVPPSAISSHLLTLNRVALYRDTLDNLSKASTDPVRAKLALEKYTEMMVLVIHIPKQLSNYFDVQNIVFLPKEPGYMFTVGYTIK